MTSMRGCAALLALATVVSVACGRGRDGAYAGATRNLVLVTIDTLRADHVGAYGYGRAQTGFIDRLAASGARFERAYAAAPITLPSHATILTGRYPPGHGARDNGMRMSPSVPTLATELHAHGFKTGAFVAAFPLDHQFGLERGFDVYSDRLPRDAKGRLTNERPAKDVVDEAIAWLRAADGAGAPNRPRFFLWVHVFEPHAPYGNPADGRPPLARYDDEIGAADRELVRLLDPLAAHPDTVTVVASDHGEAFGEHGEQAHSIFVYDTTLRVPLVIRGRGTGQTATVVQDAVTLADVAPTAMKLLGFELRDVDGIDLSRALAGGPVPKRAIYAESFAPLVEFGWAPLRSVRDGTWKYIAAPKPELYDVAGDEGERTNVIGARAQVVRDLERRTNGFAPDTLAARGAAPGGEAADRLRALGYMAQSAIRTPQAAMRPDPKDRISLAARIAQVTAGELTGTALVDALEGILREDPGNGQAHLRLGYALGQAGDCGRAEREFRAALDAGLRTADAFLGLATCLGQRRDLQGADQALQEARRLEPDNPVIAANVGILKASQGDQAGAIEALQAALARDPDLHEARFNLALVYARIGRPAEAAAAAQDLLKRLPLNAPQRPEVERLIRAIETSKSKQ